MNPVNKQLEALCNLKPEAIAFSHVVKSKIVESLTFAHLFSKVQKIAAAVTHRTRPGDRVIVAMPNSVEFVCTFLACIWAGVIPVPIAPPRYRRRGEAHVNKRLVAVNEDSQPRFAMTTATVKAQIARHSEIGPSGLDWYTALEMEGAEDGVSPRRNPRKPCYLQYTSGSTAIPKGVMVSNENIVHNIDKIITSFGLDERSRFLGWLPLTHDMGLVGHLLVPLFLGVPSFLMTPQEFATRPLDWLRHIEFVGATVSGGPNTAYKKCVELSRRDSCEECDLSTWRIAYNGSERIDASTLEDFTAAFEGSGFEHRRFVACYGLAECTLFVSATKDGESVRSCEFDASSLADGEARLASDGKRSQVVKLVSVGKPVDEIEVAVVEQGSRRRCQEGHIGELFIAGPSVSPGYWNNDLPQANTSTVHTETTRQEMLATGDIGFFFGGELFITGRSKETLILGGLNYAPEEVEQVVLGLSKDSSSTRVAAFTIEYGGVERLVIVQEIARQVKATSDFRVIARDVRREVSACTGIAAHDIVLVPAKSLPTTPNGKLMRVQCKSLYTQGELPAQYSYLEDDARHAGQGEEKEVMEFLWRRIESITSNRSSRRNSDLSFFDLGVDSVGVTEVIVELTDQFGVEVPIDVATREIAVIAKYVASQLAGRQEDFESSIEQPSAPLHQYGNVDRVGGELEVSRTEREAAPTVVENEGASPTVGLLFFGVTDEEQSESAHDLALSAARVADERGLDSVWIPERHFHAFGALSPNPAVLAASIAAVTRQVRIRAGSVVAPLHEPMRIVEDWAVVDQISRGRVDIAFAAGWNPDDYVINPHNYADRYEKLYEYVDLVSELWKGRRIQRRNGKGISRSVGISPRPVQESLNYWITCTRRRSGFVEAGKRGANVLTALLFQDVDSLAEAIEAYRTSRSSEFPDGGPGIVSLMLHTYIAPEDEPIGADVRMALERYLTISTDLWQAGSPRLAGLSSREREVTAAISLDRFISARSLIGTPDCVEERMRRLFAAGVDELVCLVDFGLAKRRVLRSVVTLSGIRAKLNKVEVGLPCDGKVAARVGESGIGREQADGITLVTGATGFLGSSVVANLMESGIRDVCCLVRAADQETADRRLRNAIMRTGRADTDWQGGVRAIPGDLTDPTLGLSPDRYSDIAGRVSRIIHLGALVNLTASRSQLERVNVAGTANLLEFAARGRKCEFYHGSTTAVLGSAALAGNDQNLGFAHQNFRAPETEYARSKYVAEQLVARTRAERGVNAVIMRIGIAAPDSTNIQYSKSDLFCGFVRLCAGIHAVPSRPTVIDCLPVDLAGQWIADIVRDGTTDALVHLISQNGLEVAMLASCMVSRGIECKSIPLETWQVRAFEYASECKDKSLRAMTPLLKTDFVPGHGSFLEYYCRMPKIGPSKSPGARKRRAYSGFSPESELIASYIRRMQGDGVL